MQIKHKQYNKYFTILNKKIYNVNKKPLKPKLKGVS